MKNASNTNFGSLAKNSKKALRLYLSVTPMRRYVRSFVKYTASGSSGGCARTYALATFSGTVSPPHPVFRSILLPPVRVSGEGVDECVPQCVVRALVGLLIDRMQGVGDIDEMRDHEHAENGQWPVACQLQGSPLPEGLADEQGGEERQAENGP